MITFAMIAAERRERLLPHYHFHRARLPAQEAMRRALADLQSGLTRYTSAPGKPSPAVTWQEPRPVGNLPFPQYQARGLAYVENIHAAGLREVGRVQSECGGRDGYWNESGGWYTDPDNDTFRDGSGLCYGLVFQLPARDGKARFVAGYEFGGVEGGPTVDFGTIYESPVRWTETINGRTYAMEEQNAPDMAGAHEAARAADGMAKSAAEDEKEYQCAWRAGTIYAEKGDEIDALKLEARALLKERREARAAGAMAYPAMCEGLRKLISGMVADIARKRAKRETLKSGDHSRYSFWDGDARLVAAFNEGAGI